MDYSIKDYRNKAKMTQAEAAKFLGVSLRSYKSYEKDKAKEGSLKYKYMLQQLEQLSRVDETHGVLDTADIKQTCEKIFLEYDISYAYLFGSYAKGTASETSDVDILVSSEVSGLKFFGFVEKIRKDLHKNVDILTRDQLIGNPELLDEILKEGIRIYG